MDAPMDNMQGDPGMFGGEDVPPTEDDMMNNNNMPMGGDMGADAQAGSQFDTNFDAGVEADEDTDPKKYIQQLTGKLSTTLNSYNSENADDDGLNKYVAKMIVKASTKNMDEPDKKEVIKAINTSQNDEPVEDDMESEPDDVDNDQQPTDVPPVNDGGMEQQDEMPIQECGFTKQQIQEMAKRKRK